MGCESSRPSVESHHRNRLGILRLQSGGVKSGISYTVTPDASGNWSVPASKFGDVTKMISMFMECTSLTSLDLSGLNTSNVTNMSNMFFDCHNLTSLNLSGWNTSNVTDMRCMFFNCWDLRTLDVSGWDLSNVTDMIQMFDSCNNLKTIKMVGCSEETINKIKGVMPSGCSIVTE